MSLPHDSAHTHVTGQSEYVDDRPFVKNEVFVDVFYSPHAHAQIAALNTAAALKEPGVLAVYTAKDVHHNFWGPIFQDQPVIADKEVNFVGEPIAVIVAETKAAAREGRNKIRATFKPLPAILSISDAIEQKSFIGNERHIARGDFQKAFHSAPHKLEGNITLRGADHFYLESQAAITYPKEDNQVEVHCSSQHPTEVQHVVAHTLGVPSSNVVCTVKRMGGGFGGKESQAAPFAAFTALAAHHLKRPARCVITKDDDMIMTGKRNPFKNQYRVGFDEQGNILALEVKLFSDGGAYADLSTAIMERAMLHCDNAYFIPNMHVTGQVCRTHFHPHTAFRGFGGPKGVATIEKIIEEIAHFLNKDALEIRKRNVYQNENNRNITHYDQKVENNCLPALFEQLEKDCNYVERRKEIQEYNKKSLSNKQPDFLKGLSVTAVKFGISFTTRFLNQGNALVIVHRDGSLQVSTGATEMGQGVNARIAQVVAEEFGLPRDIVRMMATTTDKNANTSPTAASKGTDLNASAAVLAARKIKARLSEVAIQLLKVPKENWAKNTAGLGNQPELNVSEFGYQGIHPNTGADWLSGTQRFHGIEFRDGFVFATQDSSQKMAFADLVNEAYLNRISLSDYAHYKVPDLSFNKLTGKGNAFLYYTQGVAASQVRVDLVTGEVKVDQCDILMDLGRPINEGLDMGQVTGGFVQGLGWMTTEKLSYNSQGLLLSHSPSTYKIPNVQDTPRSFNVKLLQNHGNMANLRGTKAVGEPPLLLAISAWTAVHDALKALPQYRKNFPQIEVPATQEEVLKALYAERFALWNTP